jgi:hypothetical protein
LDVFLVDRAKSLEEALLLLLLLLLQTISSTNNVQFFKLSTIPVP